MSKETLNQIREVVDDTLRNGFCSVADASVYLDQIEDILIDAGLIEQNEMHDACKGRGCIECNYGRVRQANDRINPHGSKPLKLTDADKT